MESRISESLAGTKTDTERPGGPLVTAARGIEAKSHDVIDKTHQVLDKLAQTKDKVATKTVGELVDGGRSVIRENPVNAILISAGIGALIGFALGRRR